jgi:sugar O-acyltransferase (sialic acid O-acetyltransferase NeuD family)
MKELILIGGGGHFKSAMDVIEQENRFKIKGIVDKPHRRNEKILGYPVIACDDEIPDLVNRFTHFFITVGQIQTPEPRTRIFDLLKGLGLKLPVIVSPFAHVSPHASIDEGTIIMHGAVVNAGAVVGKNCIVNTRAVIEHDVLIESHCHIATGAIINGDAVVREKSFVGSQVMVREGIEIGRTSVIGAGVALFQPVPENSFIKRC